MPDVPINTKEATWRFVTVLARSTIFVTFALAGLTKIGHPELFGTEIRNYELFPEMWTNLLAFWLPWVELLVAFMLLFGMWRRETHLLITVLLVAYLLVTLSAVVRGLEVECGCFTKTVLNRAFAGGRGMVLDVFLLGCLLVESSGWRRLHPPAAPADTDTSDDPTA